MIIGTNLSTNMVSISYPKLYMDHDMDKDIISIINMHQKLKEIYIPIDIMLAYNLHSITKLIHHIIIMPNKELIFNIKKL
jgi:hypothetical protein